MKIDSSAYPHQKAPEVLSQVHELLQKHMENNQVPAATIR